LVGVEDQTVIVGVSELLGNTATERLPFLGSLPAIAPSPSRTLRASQPIPPRAQCLRADGTPCPRCARP
jgi:hypothetical protein